ncbi:hypothetical protein [Haloferula sp. BvORR071]|uniref:hypothetical protein n=1 Tax=Haloferula sp. BvORR071 TaxID=1396141 RepID=UPI000557D539|nr:hypothetical protein [Haloferula sp. BvORR071]
MKAISFLLAMALLAPLSAQAQQGNPTRPRGRVVPPPQAPGQPWAGQVNSPDADAEADSQLPEANFTISLEGTLSSGPTVDLQLTGSGPSFTADQTIGEEGSILSCQYKLSKTEKGYRVSYSIGTQLRIATSVSKGQNEATNYEYRSIVLSGAVLCIPGAPIVIARNAGKPLTLSVAELPVPTAPEKEH